MGSALSSVGESVATKMGEKQKEMATIQRENQMKMMEAQMKKQISMQMASTREFLNWQAGVYGLLVVAVTGRVLAKKPVHAAAGVPLILFPIIMAYQADLAYGNKLDRIKAEADRILGIVEKMVFSTLSIYRAAQTIKGNKFLASFMVPMGRWWYKAAGFQQYGLRGDDVISEENPEMQEVLRRIPKEELYRRQYRLKVAFQKSLMHEILPKDQWTTPENDVPYITPTLIRYLEEQEEKQAYLYPERSAH